MERPSDTPFFVGKNANGRHGLRLVHGSGEEPADYESRRKVADGQHIETVISKFLTESGLDPDDFENDTVDVVMLEGKFAKFIRKETRATPFGLQKLVKSMTFADVTDICERWAQASRESVRLMPLDAPEEIRNVRFPAASYFAKINSIMQEAVSMTAIQKAARRNIVIVHPDEIPDEAS